VEFHQQHRLFAQAEPAVRVDHAHAVGVDQLDPGDRHPELDGLDRGLHRLGDAGERTHGRRDRLRHGVDAQRHFGDHAQRALAADEQPREVVAGGGLPRARAGADHLAAAGDHFQRQHVLAHGAVAHRVGPRGARGRHAADGSVGAGVDREEQARGLEGFVQLLAGDAGLHRHRQVVGVDRQHLVHPVDVDADAAAHREQVALDRRAGAAGDHRGGVLPAQPHRVRDVLRVLREHHARRRRHRERRLVAAMLLAHGQRGGKALAEAGPQRFQQDWGHGLLADFGNGGG